VKGKNFKEKF